MRGEWGREASPHTAWEQSWEGTLWFFWITALKTQSLAFQAAAELDAADWAVLTPHPSAAARLYDRPGSDTGYSGKDPLSSMMEVASKIAKRKRAPRVRMG